ncbi:MAG: hypothetical protein GF419_01650 [Ignavibacteriales bacterium]|nr:hypothetical protein [Ignavibacteriales bacterium]
MRRTIAAVVDVRDETTTTASRAAVAAGIAFAKTTGDRTIVYANGIDERRLERLSYAGTDRIVAFDAATAPPDALARAIAERAAEDDVETLVFAEALAGLDLAPLVAAELDAAYVSGARSVERTDDGLLVTRRAYGAALEQTVRIKTARVALAAGAGLAPLPERAEVLVERAETPTRRGRIESLERRSLGDGVDLSSAEIIVSGGMGLKKPKNFDMITTLAEALGGAVGATRAVVDAGWRDRSEQIGLTGATVAPKCYLAFGVSGAAQHRAGIADAKIVVAINADPDAPIFRRADYGIVGDALEIAPALTEIIQAKTRNDVE